MWIQIYKIEFTSCVDFTLPHIVAEYAVNIIDILNNCNSVS